MTPIEWFYAQEGRQLGPISPEELRRMAEEGELATTDLVWREGLPEWVPAIRVRGLFEFEEPPEEEHVFQQTVSAAVPVEDRTHAVAVAERPIRVSSNHPFSTLLAWYRDMFHVRRIEAISEYFDTCGHFALYVFMFLCLVLGGAITARTHGLSEADLAAVRENITGLTATGLALVAALAAFVLQYTARRMNAEIRERLVVEPFGDSASRGVSDTVALWAILGGLLAFVGLAVAAFVHGNLIVFVGGVCFFVFLQFLAVAAATPRYLGLDIPEEVTMRGQAIGIPKFTAKLILAGVPVAFGLAMCWGCFLLLCALVVLFGADAATLVHKLESVEGLALDSYMRTATFAALPLFAVALFSAAVVLIRLLEKIVE